MEMYGCFANVHLLIYIVYMEMESWLGKVGLAS